MSVITIVALMVIVMVAGGFYVGRSRAIAAVGGNTVRLHSLPNYHGYYVAIWAGLPAFVLLAAYGLFGGELVMRLSLADLEREAAGLNAHFEERLLSDAEYQEFRGAALQLRERIQAIGEDMQRLRDASGTDREPARLEDLRQSQLEALNSATAAEEAAIARRQALVAAVGAEAEAGGVSMRELAGFELAQAPRERRQLFLSDAMRIADGALSSRESAELNAAARVVGRYQDRIRYLVSILALVLATAGLVRTRSQIGADFRARNHVERLITGLLLFSSVLAIMTTVGIVFSLLFESIRFFSTVPVSEFLFGLQWSPQIALRADQVGQSGAFGAVPLFAGTALITVIAMAVAVPIGLLSAIYLSEYAGPRFRATAKPVLEILAGIPTVVYGFFALLTVGPAIRGLFTALGFEDVVTQSALSAGLVMGVMIIPFISSLSDDVINSVPQTLRDGSYAMGATRSETITRVVMPAALPASSGPSCWPCRGRWARP